MTKTRTEEFTAVVSPRIITKADRFFDNSLTTILTELVQNSRRAGATELAIITADLEGGGHTITLHDNGPGVEDPRTLLTMGESAWEDDRLEEVEDPAGMGFFSLAHVGCLVSSRNWTMSLTKEQFTGAAPANIIFGADDTEGVKISFDWFGQVRSEYCYGADDPLAYTINRVVEFCPMHVTINGEVAEQRDFLHDSIMSVGFEGVRLGVVPGKRRETITRSKIVNFFGQTVDARDIPDVSGYGYTVVVDVTSQNTEMRLQLPHRAAVVANEFWEKVKARAHKLLYESIISCQSGVHQLDYKVWKEGRDLGVELPESVPELFDLASTLDRDQRTSTRSGYTWRDRIRVDDKEKRFVAFGMVDPCLQVLGVVPELMGGNDIILVGTNSRMSGYSWYDGLPYVEAITVKDGDGKILVMTGAEVDEDTIPEGLPQITPSMTIELKVSDGDEPYVYDLRALVIEHDDYWGGVDDLLFTVSQTCVDDAGGSCPDDIFEAFMKAGFDYSDDSQADSYETQQDRFSEELGELFALVFKGDVQAARDDIKSRVESWDWQRLLKQAECKSVTVRCYKTKPTAVTFK